jgi:hypothetical protein
MNRKKPRRETARRGFLQVWEYEFAWRATRQPQHTTGEGGVKEEAPDGGTFRGFFGFLGTAMGGNYHRATRLPPEGCETTPRGITISSCCNPPRDRTTGEGRVKSLELWLRERRRSALSLTGMNFYLT